MTTVETALGPIADSELSITLSHEHVLVSLGNEARSYPWLFDWDATRKHITGLLAQAKQGGVDTIIDLTTPDLGRDVRFVASVAQGAGINIVVATGIWLDVPRSFWSRDPDEIASIFVREIEEGIEDTGIRAGVIKVANDIDGVTPEAERVLRGAARALRATGCPISTHHWAQTQVGARQVEIFREEGAPMDRICIGHSADTTDVGYLESLLRSGVYLSMDRYPSREGRPNWEQRNATVQALIERGWADRIMLGHDNAPRPLRRDAPDPPPEEPNRYLFLLTVALPALRKSGVDEETVARMMRDVPRRFLTGSA